MDSGVALFAAGGGAVAAILRDADWICDGDPLSVTATTKFEDEVEVGVPEITPEGDRVSPVGRLPELTDHVYEAVPPLARRLCEYAVPLVAAASEVGVMLN